MKTLWIDAARSGAENMAWDQTLLDLAEAEGRFVVRLYRWEPYCLSLGRHEPALRRYDRERLEAAGLEVVRRPTGGRAVWHADELTYAVAAPAAELGSLPEAYAAIHRVLARAVTSLGCAATLAEPPARSPALDAGACFAAPAGGEVVAAGRKVVGSAQVRQGAALLQHGSMLLGGDQALVAEFTRGAAPPDRSAPLARLVGRTVTFDEAADAVAREFRKAWTGGWHETSAAAPDAAAGSAALAARRSAHERRFRDAAWTWSR